VGIRKAKTLQSIRFALSTQSAIIQSLADKLAGTIRRQVQVAVHVRRKLVILQQPRTHHDASSLGMSMTFLATAVSGKAVSCWASFILGIITSFNVFWPSLEAMYGRKAAVLELQQISRF